MDEIFKAELEADRGEVDLYRTSTPTTKAFAWFKKCCDAKKYCLVSFILLVLLLLQVTILYVSMLGTIAVGFWSNGKEAIDGTMTAFGWIYNFMMVPLQGTMFAILAFFIASAAYRSFRARSREAAVLLIAAVIVMMGRVPLGEYLIPISGDLSQWILNVLNASVRRAILIGVSLGTVALSIKIIFGMERSYLGGGKE